MLGGIVQTGKEAVNIYLFEGQFVGICGQQVKVDIVQLIDESGNTLEVIQGGLTLLAGVRLVDVEGGSAGPGVNAVAAQMNVMLFVTTAQVDLGRRFLNKFQCFISGETYPVLFFIYFSAGLFQR
jgi:hypothetical protein